jgi:hypothetical protein
MQVRADAAPGINISALNAFGVRLMRELPQYQPRIYLAEAQEAPMCLRFSGDARNYMASSTMSFAITTAGTCHAFAFWWNIHLGKIVSSTGPEEVDTHWRQGAVMLSPPRQLFAGDIIDLCVSIGLGVNGGIDISLSS